MKGMRKGPTIDSQLDKAAAGDGAEEQADSVVQVCLFVWVWDKLVIVGAISNDIVSHSTISDFV